MPMPAPCASSTAPMRCTATRLAAWSSGSTPEDCELGVPAMSLDAAAKSRSGFCVAKADLRRWRWEEREAPGGDLAPGQVLVGIDKFAFTANNVTYARLGDQIAYWRFFPAPEGWGYIPVWGLGTVVCSRHREVREGERVYGYFPMTTHLVIAPQAPRGARFIDGAAHRQALPRTYNEYVLVDRDLQYDWAHENEHLVLRPLFSLSFFCAEFLKEEQFFGARQVIISSASSKTGLGLAFLLAQQRPAGVEIVGLTSAANTGFVERRRVFDRVLGYGAIPAIAAAPAVFVDIAGDGAVRAAVHRDLGEALQHSARVGFTHWHALTPMQTGLPGPAPQPFFTPDHILKRRQQWGAELLAARLSTAWRGLLGYVKPWLVIEHTTGRAGMERVYGEGLDGRTPPEKAHVVSIAGP